jgi:hypothetical protein
MSKDRPEQSDGSWNRAGETHRNVPRGRLPFVPSGFRFRILGLVLLVVAAAPVFGVWRAYGSGFGDLMVPMGFLAAIVVAAVAAGFPWLRAQRPVPAGFALFGALHMAIGMFVFDVFTTPDVVPWSLIGLAFGVAVALA